MLDEKLVFFVTLDDLDCPVEKGSRGVDVVALRVELVNDVAELQGTWKAAGEVSLDRGCCLVVDPTVTLPPQAQQIIREPPSADTDLDSEAGYIVGCVLGVPVGRYRVEEFTTVDLEIFGVRLRLV